MKIRPNSRRSQNIVDRREEGRAAKQLASLKRQHMEQTGIGPPTWATINNSAAWFGKTPKSKIWPMEKPTEARILDEFNTPSAKRASQILGKLGSK